MRPVVKPPTENPAAPPPAHSGPGQPTGATGPLEGGVGVALRNEGGGASSSPSISSGKLSSQQIQVLLTRGRRCV